MKKRIIGILLFFGLITAMGCDEIDDIIIFATDDWGYISYEIDDHQSWWDRNDEHWEWAIWPLGGLFD